MAVNWYGLFRFIHVVSAIFFMGPHFVTALMIKQLGKDPESAPRLFPLVEKARRVPAVGGLVMLLSGVFMVIASNSGWRTLGELWIAASLALFIFIVIWNRTLVSPFNALRAAVLDGPVKPDAVKLHTGRIITGTNVVGVALVAIIVLMILRPTL